MINMISILNCFSFLLLLGVIFGIILKFKKKIISGSVFIPLLISFSLLLAANFTNILEHTGINPEFDKYEDVLEVLSFPIFLFSIFIGVIQHELNERKKEERKFKGIFNNMFSFIALLDKEGSILEINDVANKNMQSDISVFKKALFWEVDWWRDKEQKEKVKHAFESAKNGNIERFELQYKSKEGKPYIIDFSIKPYFNEKGEIEFIIPEARDITVLKETEMELRRLKGNLEVLVKQRTEELETVMEELYANNDELFVKNEELSLLNAKLSDNQEEIKALNQQLLERNEELNNINDALLDKGLQLERTLQKLKEAQAHMIQSEKMISLGVLTAGIAHEINNPINYIKSGIYGFQKAFDKVMKAYNNLITILKESPNSEIEAKILEVEKQYDVNSNLEAIQLLSENINKGVMRTFEIVRSLKNVAYSENSGRTAVDINEMIESALTILYHEYKNHINIVKDMGKIPYYECVPGKMNQVFLNIIMNAIQAIEDKGTITIKSEMSKDKKNVLISIKDTGKGMDISEIPKIFDPFYTTKPIGKGTGLGLYICFNIIKEHNGKIEVKSETNKGTEFLVSLPLRILNE
ncbi:MAG: PAS domain-containing protein [Bacteroidales bacterium]|nr:PAS domain-containing protein [Bacteroidales bacterium]